MPVAVAANPVLDGDNFRTEYSERFCRSMKSNSSGIQVRVLTWLRLLMRFTYEPPGLKQTGLPEVRIEGRVRAVIRSPIRGIDFTRWIAGLILLTLLQGCARLPEGLDLPASHAFNQPEQTRLGRLAGHAAAHHDGESGFYIQDTGRDAFLQRVALIEAAEKSIDAQYYIWNSDTSGRYLAQRLLLAADRGVRVRLLLDDFNIGGRDALLAALDSHPNIEIRIYNPFATREGPGKLMEAAGDFQRINRRMHNKTFVVDGAFGIVGGRNIGDEYFGLHPEVNFLDRDMMAAGSIVVDISGNFDRYWNSHAAYPVSRLAGKRFEPEQVKQLLTNARDNAGDTRELTCKPPQQADRALTLMREWVAQLVWAPAELVYSEPVPQALPDVDYPAATADRLRELMESSRNEVLIESAYLILGERQLKGVATLSSQGVQVRAITNSLASNDLIGNHAGYARTRQQMLESGIELLELRPDGRICATCTAASVACSGDISLHAKTMVFDRTILYVGSFNINLRSIYLNGETTLIVHSPQLAVRVAESIENAMGPDNSWKVEIEEGGALKWEANDGVYRHEPATGWWRRFKSALVGLLPIEKYY